jgi:glycosyltransferase involved in cell wall biosynthesis
MRILHINETYNFGSTGRIARELCDYLRKEGNETLICYGRNHLPPDEKSFDISSKLDNVIQCAQTRFFDNHGFSTKSSAKKLIEAIETFKPDIIHLQNIHGYFLNLQVLFEYLGRRQIPVVWTLQDCWSLTGHCSHFDYIGCMKWKTGCYDCENLREYPKSFFSDNSKTNWRRKKELFSLPKELVIVPCCKWIESLARESYFSGRRIEHIYNGIDMDIFKPTGDEIIKKYDIPGKTIVLGVTNIWSYKKGLHYFNRLAEELPDQYAVVLVGDLRGNEVSQKIKHVPQTQNVAELAALYSCAEVFVNPTLEDTFPTTNIEALACDTPVITFRTGGSAESIDENSGISVERDDYESLKAAVIKKCEEGTAKGICRERAKKFDKNRAYSKYTELFREIMEDNYNNVQR